MPPAWSGIWPPALLGGLALFVLIRREGARAAALRAAPALFWLFLLFWTGDRRLFFPYAIHLAQASAPLLLAAAFFAVRIHQAATLDVLILELFVTAAVLLAGAAIQRQRPPVRRFAAPAAALLALLGLLL